MRGWKVLLLEKNPQPGGNCSSKKFGDYTFDLAVHQLSGVAGTGICAGILRELGIADKVEFRRVDPFLVIDMPDRAYQIRADKAALREELVRNFPEDAPDIDRMFVGLDCMRKDAMIGQRILYGKDPVIDRLLVSEITPWKLASFPFTAFWGFLLRGNSSADDILRRWVKNPRLRAVLLSSWPYLGLPPSGLSGLMMNIFLSMQHSSHTYYPVGSSQKLSDALAEAFIGHGGRLLLGTPVTSILTESGRVTGAEFGAGERAYAPVVISNIDLSYTYGTLLGPGAVPARFSRRLASMTRSMGPFRVCLGLDYDVAKNGLEHHEYMILPGYDHDRTYCGIKRGDMEGISLYSPTKICPGLAPPGHSTLVLTTMVAWTGGADWRNKEEEISGRMIRIVERRLLPGLSGHIAVKEIMTPEDLRRLTNSSEGAMYGWANTPGQSLLRRAPVKSPLRGLYHVGHWTRPGTGVTSAIQSGWLLANRLTSPVCRYLDRMF